MLLTFKYSGDGDKAKESVHLSLVWQVRTSVFPDLGLL